MIAAYKQFWDAVYQRVSSLHDCPGELRDLTSHHFCDERYSLLTWAVVEPGIIFFSFLMPEFTINKGKCLPYPLRNLQWAVTSPPGFPLGTPQTSGFLLKQPPFPWPAGSPGTGSSWGTLLCNHGFSSVCAVPEHCLGCVDTQRGAGQYWLPCLVFSWVGPHNPVTWLLANGPLGTLSGEVLTTRATNPKIFIFSGRANRACLISQAFPYISPKNM